MPQSKRHHSHSGAYSRPSGLFPYVVPPELRGQKWTPEERRERVRQKIAELSKDPEYWEAIRRAEDEDAEGAEGGV